MTSERVPGCSYGESQLIGADGMPNVGPYLAARMRRRDRINAHVQGARNFRRPLFAVDPIRDRDFGRTQILADQRREVRNWASGCSGKDRAQRLRLFVIGPLINVGGDGPVS